MMSRGEWITVNDVPTYVKTWGGWINDEIQSDSVLICITGNPGVTDFYFKFLSTLQPLINMPVWIICHAGQQVPPGDLNSPSLTRYPELYNLEGQIEHKRVFIRRFVPKHTNIYLIGHSVGAKICVELLKDEKIGSRTKQVHLIFPTLQHIRETPNGRLFTSLLQYLIPVLVAMAWLFCHLPRRLRYRLISVYFWMRRDWPADSQCIDGTVELFKPRTAKAALSLALDEMDQIKELDNEVYEKHWEKISCYYALNDRWAPLSQYEDLMKKHPKVNGKVLEEKFTHAFVLTTSVEMAHLLSLEITSSQEAIESRSEEKETSTLVGQNS